MPPHSLLEPLLSTFIVGTDRQAPDMPQLPSPLRELLPQVEKLSGTPATTLLRVAGILSLSEYAGFAPWGGDPLEISSAEDISPSAEVSTDEPDTRLADLANGILEDGSEILQRELLSLLANKARTLPHGALVKALELARHRESMRPPVIAVLGSRGRWLAARNPEWAFALVGQADGLLDEVWATGTLEQRSAYFENLRTRDPAAARALLAEEFTNLPPRERFRLVGKLAVGLSAEDGPWLESLLSDRSADVRQTVRGLLMSLSTSGYASRMATRLANLLRGAAEPETWVIEPPETFPADWSSDAMRENKPSHETLGTRAYWLRQVIESVPMTWWEQRSNGAVDACIRWAITSEWREAILRGWLGSLNILPRPTWIRSLAAFEVIDTWHPLQAFREGPERESYWRQALHRQTDDGRLLSVVQSMVFDPLIVKQGLSPTASREVIQKLGNVNAVDSLYYQIGMIANQLAALIHPSVLEECLRSGLVPEPSVFGQEFSRIIQCRLALHQLI